MPEDFNEAAKSVDELVDWKPKLGVDGGRMVLWAVAWSEGLGVTTELAVVEEAGVACGSLRTR